MKVDRFIKIDMPAKIVDAGSQLATRQPEKFERRGPLGLVKQIAASGYVRSAVLVTFECSVFMFAKNICERERSDCVTDDCRDHGNDIIQQYVLILLVFVIATVNLVGKNKECEKENKDELLIHQDFYSLYAKYSKKEALAKNAANPVPAAFKKNNTLSRRAYETKRLGSGKLR
ncbi:hypothetical protein QS306_06215 [Paraburkholderia bonniea]|uniref:hypothetical protein n=1 Tax=Paraburkholderia bonniea TaxID=2152891 RepID=UPI001291C476|nr:hypothetical protein [Paraburkholderia bonniea]WJF91226.1 hypothetical protein QS306_06215 [Paraburkholderia bonniea]WJF94541.1 hypothetical protein QS308_06225 [Paraburkholderia bonniea]